MMQPYGPFRHIGEEDVPYTHNVAGILKHSYVNASDDVAAYQADQCGRQAVTAQFAWDWLCDETVYLFLEESNSLGMEGWLAIDAGIDRLTSNGDFVLCFGRTGEIVVSPEHRLFVSRKTLQSVLEGR